MEASYKGFSILTDQPEKHGGDGSAPAPFDLFLASIGTCGAYYVLAFCRARRIPLENIKVTLSTEKNVEKRILSKIMLDIHLPPDFPEKYRGAVVKAAHYCAVTKHFFDPPEIEVRTVTAE